MIDRSVEYEKMAKVEKELWWYRVLHELTHSAIRRQFGADTSIRIVDLGCGTGGLMMYLKQLGYDNIQGFDLSDDAVRICNDRGLNVSKGNMLDVNKLVEEGMVDVLVTNDTLYFVPQENRTAYVLQLALTLRPEGLLIFNLPSMEIFRGMHDKSVGIDKRFESEDVLPLLSKSQLELLTKRFWPFSVSPLIYLIRLNQRWQMRRSPNAPIKSDVEMPNRMLNTILEGLVKLECRLLRSGLFGSSIFVAARKNAPIHQEH